jgi:hypothetical protein
MKIGVIYIIVFCGDVHTDRATSEGETGSHDLILDLTLGNSGSSVKRKSQHIEPQDDSAGVAGSTSK